MTNYWLISTSPENFEKDRQNNFTVQGFTYRHRKLVQQVKPGDKCVSYIYGLQRIGAICTVTSGYYHDDKNRVWVEDKEIWPSRFKTKPEIVLDEEQLLDIKKLVPYLSFITPGQRKATWGLALRYSLRIIPQEDFELIESEMRKAKGEFASSDLYRITQNITSLTEKQAKKAIMELNLQSRSLHDRIGEMLETIGSRMGYNAYTRHKVTPEHSVELDVAWLKGKNPEVAIEIQIGGNIVEAKDRLSQSRKFNYRKIIMVIEETQLSRLNAIVKFDEVIDWMDAWSIPAVYELYSAGMSFLGLYDKLIESRYKKKTEVEFIKG